MGVLLPLAIKRRASLDEEKKRLAAIISRHTVWVENPTAEAEGAARAALLQFLAAIRATRPDKLYRDGNAGYFCYLRFLEYVDAALRQKRYKDTCNELNKLIHFVPVTQKRILYNVECLLAEHLEG